MVSKVNVIDSGRFVLKTNKSSLEKKIDGADKKISDTRGLAKKSDYNAKVTETEGKISNIITSALNTVQNKIPNGSDLVKKPDIETIYFTIPHYKKFTSEILDTKIKEKGLEKKI